MPWICNFCGAVYDYITSKMMDHYYQDTGVRTSKITIRAEAKPGEVDTLKEELRKYRLSELIKGFDFAWWARNIIETGRLNRLKAKESNAVAIQANGQ